MEGLKFFNDKSQNFLLQNPDDTLEIQDPSLQVEPIFTEIDGTAGWPVEGYPVLLNGSFISEDQPIEPSIRFDTDRIQLSEFYEDTDQTQDSSAVENSKECDSTEYPIVSEIPGKGFVTADGLFVPNELLLQLNSQNENHLNGRADKIIGQSFHDHLYPNEVLKCAKLSKNEACIQSLNSDAVENQISEDVEENLTADKNELFNVSNFADIGDVIQLLNSDGAVITLDKSILNSLSVSPPDLNVDTEKNYQDMFEVLTAYKCKFCAFLCESVPDMINHLKIGHTDEISKTEHCKTLPVATEQTKNDSVAPLTVKTVEMRSILNVNQRNKETKKTVYLCSQCNMGYSNKENLREHMILKHNLVNLTHMQTEEEKPIAQTNGPATETDATESPPKPKMAKDLLTNLVRKQQKASKKIKCCVKGCELRFARDDLRIRHEECHVEGQKKQFKCPECQEKFSAWRICSSHLWKCHSIDTGLLACPMCNKFKSASFGRMRVHMAIHDEEFPFMCHYCGKGFKQYSQLKNHQVIHKNPELDKLPEWASQKQCDICKKYFANSKTLKKHVQIVHNKYKPFICNICGHKAARKAMLELHLRQHTGEKPHKCTLCAYKTGDPNCLRRHIMRHEGLTKYSCPHCDYQSIQSTSYKNHIANKHPGKGGSYYCSICSYHTVSETSYYAHKLEHQTNQNRHNEQDQNNGTNGNVSATNGDKLNCENGGQQISSLLNNDAEMDDDETQNCFLNTDFTDETIDTGGITIPAGFELQVSM